MSGVSSHGRTVEGGEGDMGLYGSVLLCVCSIISILKI